MKIKKLVVTILALVFAFGGAIAVAQADNTYTLSEEQRDYVEEWHWLVEELSAALDARLAEELGSDYDPEVHGINWSQVMGQSLLESGAGKSDYAQKHNNALGLGGHENPIDFETYGESWEYYFDLFSGSDRYVREGSLLHKNDAEGYFTALVLGGYCPDMYYVENVSQVVGGVERYAAERAEAWEAERVARAEAEKLRAFEREMRAPIEAFEAFLNGVR